VFNQDNDRKLNEPNIDPMQNSRINSCVSSAPSILAKPFALEPTDSTAETPALTEIESLSWAIVDGLATPQEKGRLEDLLGQDSTSRSQYIRIVSMHASLMEMFSHRNPSPQSPGLAT
jgi:hypothetical protein